jgi:hypothetical protein
MRRLLFSIVAVGMAMIYDNAIDIASLQGSHTFRDRSSVL